MNQNLARPNLAFRALSESDKLKFIRWIKLVCLRSGAFFQGKVLERILAEIQDFLETARHP